MKRLLVCLSSDNQRMVINEMVAVLTKRGVSIRGITRNTVKFNPSTLMRKDIDYLIENLAFAHLKNQKSTKRLSDNGKDEEFYLTTVQEDQKFMVVINLSGTITVNPI